MYVFKVHDPFFLPHRACQLDLSLERGKGLVLTGENGLGKSTLLDRIFVQAGSKASLIIQAEPDYFYDRQLRHLKVLFLKASSGLTDEKRFEGLWDLFSLHEKENRFISQLSGGEKQMLKLIIGLSLRKDIYLLDEPSQFLDSTAKEKLANVLETLLSQGKSLLIVEHGPEWLRGYLPTLALYVHDNVIRSGP